MSRLDEFLLPRSEVVLHPFRLANRVLLIYSSATCINYGIVVLLYLLTLSPLFILIL